MWEYKDIMKIISIMFHKIYLSEKMKLFKEYFHIYCQGMRFDMRRNDQTQSYNEQ